MVIVLDSTMTIRVRIPLHSEVLGKIISNSVGVEDVRLLISVNRRLTQNVAQKFHLLV